MHFHPKQHAKQQAKRKELAVREFGQENKT
jgi:hypothetical protein